LTSDLAAKAPLVSPALTGTPTAPTPTLGDNSTKIATTAFVIANLIPSTVSSVFGRTGAVVANTGDYSAAQVTNALDMATSRTANTALMAPNGSAGVPTFRVLAAADIPAIAESGVTNLTTDLAAKAPLNSPALTGTPTSTTPSTGDNNTNIATTAFVKNQGYTSNAGTVTSVSAGTLSPLFTTAVSNATTAPTISFTAVNQSTNVFYAGPSSGAPAAPTFRAISSNDIPNLPASIITSGVFPEARGGTNQSAYTLGDILYASATNTLSRLAPNASTTRMFLSQTGNGAVSAAPAWGQLGQADIPIIPITKGGTNANFASDVSNGILYGSSPSAFGAVISAPAVPSLLIFPSGGPPQWTAVESSGYTQTYSTAARTMAIMTAISSAYASFADLQMLAKVVNSLINDLRFMKLIP